MLSRDRIVINTLWTFHYKGNLWEPGRWYWLYSVIIGCWAPLLPVLIKISADKLLLSHFPIGIFLSLIIETVYHRHRCFVHETIIWVFESTKICSILFHSECKVSICIKELPLRYNWPNSHTPECTFYISHNAPFREQICAVGTTFPSRVCALHWTFQVGTNKGKV